MKNILGLFILCVFLLGSVSVAFAEEGRGYGVRDRMQERQAQLQEKQIEREAKIDERISKLEEKREELRKKMQERLDAAKARKTAIDANAQTLRERCKAQATLEGNCGEAFTKIKEHLIKTVDRMIEALTNLKTRWTSADATETEQLTKIDAALTTLQSLKTEIAAAKTREALKAVMTKVRESWVAYKQLFKEKKNDPYQQRAASMLKKAERIQTYLRQALARVQASDSALSAAALEITLKNIDTQIAAVRTALTQGDKATIKDTLKRLHDLLQDAIKQFRQAGKGDTIAAVATAEPAPAAGVTQ